MVEKTGVELLEEAAAEPTLDEYLRRDPATLTVDEIKQMIVIERKRRAMFIEAEAAKKAKKAGDVAVPNNDLPDDEGEGEGDAA